nr:MAG TPA: hypothetical protein [Caudoviricetes sp.]
MLKQAVLGMTIEELKRSRLEEKLEAINNLIISVLVENKAPIRDEENPDCRIMCVYYRPDEDEVYGHFENVEE